MNKKYIQAAILSIVGILLICGCTQTSKNTKDSHKGSELEAVDTLHILKPSPITAMCCSTFGIFIVERAERQSRSCWRSMTG